MKTCQTKKCAWMRTPLMVVSVTYTSMALALAYNDVTAWWHFDCDADQNERADMSEIRDQRDWGTSALKASGYHATSVNGGLWVPSWTNEVRVRREVLCMEGLIACPSWLGKPILT